MEWSEGLKDVLILLWVWQSRCLCSFYKTKEVWCCEDSILTVQSRGPLYYGKKFCIPYLIQKVYSQRRQYSHTVIQLQILKLKVVRRDTAVEGHWLTEFISVLHIYEVVDYSRFFPKLISKALILAFQK